MKKNTPVPAKSDTTAAVTPAGCIDPLDWIDQAGAAADISRAIDRRLRRRRRRAAIAAGTAALLMGTFLWQVLWRQGREAERPAPASTIVMLPAHQVLPDGSIVELKTGAMLEPAFTPSLRKITLLQGEAHFQVKKDAARPFVVSVGGVEVRAVGTAFSVQFRKTAVEVLVTEGKVTVRQTGSSGPMAAPAPVPAIFVDAGNLAVVELDPAMLETLPKVELLPALELRQRLAWRVPQLQFSGTPLSEAITMINAHGPVRLTLGDAVLGRVKISGVLRADNLDTLLELLAESHGIKSEHRGPFEVELTRAR